MSTNFEDASSMNRWLLVLGVIIGMSAIGWLAYSNTSSSSQNEQPQIAIGMVTFPGYAPLYLAKEKGFFEGVDVELKRIESIGDIRAAMSSGDINVFAATYDIYQSTKDVAPTGIGFLGMDESHGGDGIAVSDEIASISDLRGKSVAAEPGFPPYLILQYLLSKEGMTLNDVNFQDVPTTDAGSAFAAGKLDAAGIYEPALSASVSARKGATVLASSKDTPGLIQDLLFADERLAQENPEVLELVAAGWFRALEYIATNEDDAYAIMADAFAVTPAEMKDFQSGITWLDKQDNLALFDRTTARNAYTTFAEVCNILKSNGDTTLCVNPDDKLTDGIISALK